jgi:hypothetical protein
MGFGRHSSHTLSPPASSATGPVPAWQKSLTDVLARWDRLHRHSVNDDCTHRIRVAQVYTVVATLVALAPGD